MQPLTQQALLDYQSHARRRNSRHNLIALFGAYILTGQRTSLPESNPPFLREAARHIVFG